MKKAIIITGNSFRHMFFVSQVEKHFDVLKVLSETKFSYQNAFKTESGQSLIERHFDAREESEKQYFGDVKTKSEITSIPKKWMTEMPEVVQEVIEAEVDVVFLFGSSIIKRNILDAYPNRVINMHLGLSPYYRGSGTNFWPLVEEKPECVGATIHLATPVVDAGAVLHQVRPLDLQPGDSIHDVGNKTIIASATVLPLIADKYLDNKLAPEAQSGLEDKEFRRMDINEQSVEKMYQNFEEGMLGDYLKSKEARDAQYPIIEQNEKIT